MKPMKRIIHSFYSYYLLDAHVNCLLTRINHSHFIHTSDTLIARQTFTIRCPIMLVNQTLAIIAIDIMTGVYSKTRKTKKNQHANNFFSFHAKQCLVPDDFQQTYHLLHSNSLLDNHVHIGTLVHYFLVHGRHLHDNKQNLRMDRFVDHMLHLHNLVDIHIDMMYLH